MAGAIGALVTTTAEGAIGGLSPIYVALGQSNDIGAYRFTNNPDKNDTSDIGAYGRINPLAASGFSIINIYYLTLLQGRG